MAAQELELESRHEKIDNWDQDHFISDEDNEIDNELHRTMRMLDRKEYIVRKSQHAPQLTQTLSRQAEHRAARRKMLACQALEHSIQDNLKIYDFPDNSSLEEEGNNSNELSTDNRTEEAENLGKGKENDSEGNEGGGNNVEETLVESQQNEAGAVLQEDVFETLLDQAPGFPDELPPSRPLQPPTRTKLITYSTQRHQGSSSTAPIPHGQKRGAMVSTDLALRDPKRRATVAIERHLGRWKSMS